MKSSFMLSVVLIPALMLPQGVFSSESTSKEFAVIKRVAAKAAPGPKATALFGEPHGYGFTNRPAPDVDRIRILEVNLSGCGSKAHLDYIGITYARAIPQPYHKGHEVKTKYDYFSTFAGRSGGGDVQFRLEDQEYIKQLDLTTYQAKTGFMSRSKRTRIGSITFTTNHKRVFTCGAKSSSDPPKSWHFDDYAFLYFSGSSGEAIDALIGHFVPVNDYFK